MQLGVDNRDDGVHWEDFSRPEQIERGIIAIKGRVQVLNKRIQVIFWGFIGINAVKNSNISWDRRS